MVHSAYDDYATFLRYGSAGAYGRAMGMEQLPFWLRLTQHPAYDEYWQDQAVDRILAARPLTVPTLLVGSEWDQEDIYGAPAVFKAVKASPNAHLALGPWHHGQANAIGYVARGRSTGAPTPRDGSAQNVMIPFLDEHLKGGPPANIARVTAFEAGTNQLAAPRRLAARLRPRLPGQPDAALSRARRRARLFGVRQAKAFDSYVSDPARPVTYRARPNLPPFGPNSTWRQWLVDDQRFAEARPDVLVLLERAADPAAAPGRHAAGPSRRLDQRHRQRLGRQADRRLPRPIPAKARARRLSAGDRDGRDPRPLPHRSGAARSRSPPTSP